MTAPKDKIKNVILCEDIREELGNKKSLMGVMGGDILVSTLPATLQVAVYFEYVPDDDETDDLLLEFHLWQDEVEVAKGLMETPLQSKKTITAALPRALVMFEKEGTFRITASVRGGPAFQIMNKKIMKDPTS